MSDLLKSINERISSYQLFNFFYLGAIFLGMLKYLQCDFVDSLSIWYFLLFSYFIGMTTSRIGSILIEDRLIKLGFIEKHDYKKQTEAEKKDSKVMLLLEICNTYRTLGAAFSVLSLICLVDLIPRVEIFSESSSLNLLLYAILFALVAVLFIFSFLKQYEYVEERIQANVSE